MIRHFEGSRVVSKNRSTSTFSLPAPSTGPFTRAFPSLASIGRDQMIVLIAPKTFALPELPIFRSRTDQINRREETWTRSPTITRPVY
jgi:hypothetical protein